MSILKTNVVFQVNEDIKGEPHAFRIVHFAINYATKEVKYVDITHKSVDNYNILTAFQSVPEVRRSGVAGEILYDEESVNAFYSVCRHFLFKSIPHEFQTHCDHMCSIDQMSQLLGKRMSPKTRLNTFANKYGNYMLSYKTLSDFINSL